MMPELIFHLYVISFVAGSESGLALVSAQDEKNAFQILKNSGSRCCDGYSLIQIRCLGEPSSCTYGLLMESFVNAKEAYDAIVHANNKIVGPRGYSVYDIAIQNGYTGTIEEWLLDMKGEKGDQGERGEKGDIGEKGNDGTSIASVEQTVVSSQDEGQNEITITLSDGTESVVYVKNGRTGVTDVAVTVDAVHGVPRATSFLEDGLFSISFTGLKGMQGNPGVNNATMLVVQSLPDPPSVETAEKIYLIYNNETGDYDRYFTQYDGQNYGWVQAGSMTVNLEDYQRKDDEVWLTQDEFDALEVKDITKVYNVYEESDEP